MEQIMSTTRPRSLRLGALVADPATRRYGVLVGAILAAAGASIMLNVRQLQFEPLLLWVRIICPMLLAIGILGSMFGSRLSRILGWLGILVFVVSAIGMVLPGEDYMSGGPDGPPLAAPRMVPVLEIVLRFALCALVTLVLVGSYYRLGKRHRVA